MINYCGYSIAATDELSSYDAFQVDFKDVTFNFSCEMINFLF